MFKPNRACRIVGDAREARCNLVGAMKQLSHKHAGSSCDAATTL